MAEYLFRNSLCKNGINIEVESMGVDVNSPSRRPSRQTMQVLKEVGIDASEHCVNEFKRETLYKSDLILVMDKEHLQFFDDELLDRTFLLSNFAHSLRKWCVESGDMELELSDIEEDINDPYGKDIDEYRLCRDIIKEYIDIIIERIKIARKSEMEDGG